MKNPISGLNKLFESRIRLGIMSVLVINESYDFNGFRETLDITDGNLASHLKVLEEHELVKVHKQFVGKRPNTRYSATEKGIALFLEHLKALEDLIKLQ